MSRKPDPALALKKMPLSITHYLPAGILFFLAFLLYGNTLTFDYVLDDEIVIRKNEFTKQGFAGIPDIFRYDSFTGFFGQEKNLVSGGRYRPLSIASYAVERGILGESSPMVSHFFNILFYGLTAVLLFVVFAKLTKAKKGETPYLGLPFIIALLFVAHPLHTEVVANIKGRDEIFALLFSLLSLLYALKYSEKLNPAYLVLCSFFLFLGLLSKENAILFILIIPLSLYFFGKLKPGKLLLPSAFLLITGIIFMAIRGLVLGNQFSSQVPGELLNNPYLNASSSQHAGTVLYSLGLYIKLLLFPYPLTHDYYPWHIPLVVFTDYRSLISLCIYTGLVTAVIIYFKKKNLAAFGVLFYLATLSIASNIVFSVGTVMNERFLYIPSLGYCLVLGWLLTEVLKTRIRNPRHYSLVTGGVLILILVGYAVQTISRNRAWENDFVLFTTDVGVSHESTKCNTSAGGKYIEKALTEKDPGTKASDLGKAIKYLEKALVIYPGNTNALLLLGNARILANNDFKGGLSLYVQVLSSDNLNKPAFGNAVKVLAGMDYSVDAQFMLSTSQFLYRINPENGRLNAILGRLYGQYKNNPDSAVFFMETAARQLPDDSGVLKDLGIAYAMDSKFEKSLSAFEQALRLVPGDEALKQNIAVTKNRLSVIKSR
ncbi:MAG: hypothetical protein WCJ26_16075 [bacterium]